MNKDIKQRYWIQDIAKDGGYFDSVGMPLESTKEAAEKQLASWKKEFPERKSRLILRIDIPLT